MNYYSSKNDKIITTMYTTIYRPKSLSTFVGNQQIIQPFIRWLLEWNEKDKNKCALVSGICGIGKTLLVELILHTHNYNVINIDLDDERDKDYMTNVIKPILKMNKTIDGQNNALVVSDIDSGSDYGFISILTEFIKETKIPIICICNNRYDQSIKPIVNYCFDIKMNQPIYQDVYRLIYDVVINEKIKIKEKDIKELYSTSNGDIRFMLNALQFGSKKGKKNIQNANIFETTGKLFSMEETIENKYNTFWLANDLHPLLIQENYVNNALGALNQLNKLENISYSANALSDMDLFETQINMTKWELSPYVGMMSIKATSKCNKKCMIKFPQFLGKI